jgi:hypothetical protein
LFLIRIPYNSKYRSQESFIGTAISHGLNGRGSILFWGKMFLLLHSVKTGSRPYTASSPTRIGVSFPRGKTAGE